MRCLMCSEWGYRTIREIVAVISQEQSLLERSLTCFMQRWMVSGRLRGGVSIFKAARCFDIGKVFSFWQVLPGVLTSG